MKKILIVEDDNFLNKLLAYNLIAEGYDVTSVLNARTAAETILQREFDLVVLDINLPDGNGFELCKLIKPQYPSTIVIFLTANDQESDQIRGYEAGAACHRGGPGETARRLCGVPPAHGGVWLCGKAWPGRGDLIPGPWAGKAHAPALVHPGPRL